jgi:hypothetical protein
MPERLASHTGHLLRVIALGVLIVALLWWMSARLSELPTQVDLAVKTNGTLVLSVFGGAESKPLDPTGFPEPVRARLKAYLQRRETFRSSLPEPPSGSPAHDEWSRRVLIERAIVSLIDAPRIASEAAAFASRAAFGSAWVEVSEGPMAEAEEAQAFLDANPATALKPYLWLFLMHRYKSALPLLRAENVDEADIGSVTRGYARARALAAGSSDPLIGLIAADIDNVRSVYPLVGASGQRP